MKVLIHGLLTFVVLFVIIPASIAFITVLLGRARRRRAGGIRLRPVWPILALGGASVASLIGGLLTLAAPFAFTVGLTDTARLHVTESSGPYDHPTYGWIRAKVSGDYELDGTLHHVSDEGWSSTSWRPTEGDEVEVSVSPWWPHVVMFGYQEALTRALLGASFVGLGIFLARGTQQESQRD